MTLHTIKRLWSTRLGGAVFICECGFSVSDRQWVWRIHRLNGEKPTLRQVFEDVKILQRGDCHKYEIEAVVPIFSPRINAHKYGRRELIDFPPKSLKITPPNNNNNVAIQGISLKADRAIESIRKGHHASYRSAAIKFSCDPIAHSRRMRNLTKASRHDHLHLTEWTNEWTNGKGANQ